MTDVLTSHDVEEGELREGWLLSTIGEQCEVVAGSTPKSAVGEYWGGDIAWLTPKDLSQNRSQFVEHGERSITESGYESCSTRLVPAGSVLFTSRAPIGYVAIAANEMCTNQGFKTAVPGSGLQSEFLYWQLQHVTPDIRSRASGTTFPEISGKGFAATEIVVPQLEEQERIVEILEDQLSRLDTALQSVHTVRTKAAQFRRSLLHAAFTGTLTGSDVEEGELPDGWAVTRLGDLADLGPKVPADLLEANTDLSFLPMAAVAEVSGEVDLTQTITAQEGKKRSLKYFADGDVIFAKITPCMENGKVARPSGLTNGAAFGSTEFHVLRPTPAIDGDFLRLVLVHDDFRYEAERAMTGAVGQRRVPKKYLEDFPLPTPPLEEQERIVKIVEDQLSRLDASLVVADAVEERSTALRRSLLHSAFTGRLTREWREAVNV